MKILSGQLWRRGYGQSLPESIYDSNDYVHSKIAHMFDDKNIEGLDESDKDTIKWKSLVPKWFYNYGNVYSQRNE
jgi:hypothetical protein